MVFCPAFSIDSCGRLSGIIKLKNIIGFGSTRTPIILSQVTTPNIPAVTTPIPVINTASIVICPFCVAGYISPE